MFEQHHETPPPQPEKGPEVDIESVLEKGEIESIEDYAEGYWPIQRVKIKDDGIALFKIETEEPESAYYARSEYEIIARKLDDFLGLGMVPLSAKRVIGTDRGVMEQFIDDAKPATSLAAYWPEATTKEELIKAAVFDYLIGAKDRHLANFLINSKTGKIWLIDHAVDMFETGIHGSRIISEIRGTRISEEILPRLADLVGKVDSVLTDETVVGEGRIKPLLIWQRIRDNAVSLMSTKTIL